MHGRSQPLSLSREESPVPTSATNTLEPATQRGSKDVTSACPPIECKSSLKVPYRMMRSRSHEMTASENERLRKAHRLRASRLLEIWD